jgi:hypothetical protein
LWLDVAVADALGMDIGQGAEELIDVQLDLENRHGRLHFVEESRSSVDSLGHKLLHQVQVDLVLLHIVSKHFDSFLAILEAHAFSIGVVKGFQLHDVGVSDDAHDLQLTILRGI